MLKTTVVFFPSQAHISDARVFRAGKGGRRTTDKRCLKVNEEAVLRFLVVVEVVRVFDI